MKKRIKRYWSLLVNPENGFNSLLKQSFDESMVDYLLLLIASGVLAGIVRFLYNVLDAAFLDIFYNIDIKYWNMVNYSLGIANGTIFFYIFAGIFILFFISLIIKPFIRIKYTRMLQVMFFSMSPLLLFGWIPGVGPAFIVWSIILFVIGIRIERKWQPKKG